MARLKVYRTAIGFHDAYVAAPSQKAALEAWGVTKDLFAHAAAEVVTDEGVMAELLASPGSVIKRLRGTVEEQLAALPPDVLRTGGRGSEERDGEPSGSAPKARFTPAASPPPPPPSRLRLEEAENALERLEGRAREHLADLERREQALASDRRNVIKDLERERSELTASRDREAAAFDRPPEDVEPPETPFEAR